MAIVAEPLVAPPGPAPDAGAEPRPGPVRVRPTAGPGVGDGPGPARFDATGGRRFDALDGLRAVLVAAVVVYHLWGHRWKADPGSIGVIGFLALSGFLITTLLTQEHDRFGRISIRNFYVRRALRLLPALGLLLGVWLAVDLLFPHGQFMATVPSASDPGNGVAALTGLQSVGAALLYVTNWMNAFARLHLWYSYSPLGHLWSLAVEEQFYLVWAPAVVLLAHLRKRWATVVTGVVAAGFLAEPLLFLHDPNFNRIYFGTDTRCGAMFCGAMVAMVARQGGWAWLGRWRGAPVLGAAILAALVVAMADLHSIGLVKRHLFMTGLILASVAGAAAVIYLVERPGGVAARLLSGRLLVALGRRSYAIYLWSYVLNTWLRDTGPLEPLLVVGATLVAAEISYRLVELPALRLKDRFLPGPGPGRPTPEVERFAATGRLPLTEKVPVTRAVPVAG